MNDRRTFLAITLCFLIYLGWQKLYLERQMPPSAPTQTTGATQAPPPGTQPPPTADNKGIPTDAAKVGAATPRPPRPPQTVSVATGTGDALVGDGNRFFVGWNLKSYRLGITPEAAVVDLHSVTNQTGEVELAFDDPQLAYVNTVQGELVKTPSGALWTYEDANLKVVRELSGNETQPWVDLKLQIDLKARRPSFAFVSLSSKGLAGDPEARDRQLVHWTADSIERATVEESMKTHDIATSVHYIGATNRYFLMSLVAQGPVVPRGLVQGIGTHEGRVSLVYPIAGNSVTIPLRAYFGPKELNLLRAVDPRLDHVLDLGWFTFIAYPLLTFLKWLYSFLHNYGLAIIVLTTCLKIVTYPLTYKSMKSMKDMAKLQPQIAKLREKHKDDKEALNREMLTLMRSGGYNPAAGCLPILIQMPVFFALYRVLYSSIELYHAPFALWIHDLSSKDPYYVTPILLSATMYLQQRLSPQTATDPAQQKMMQFMPLIFGAFMISLPSGLTIYMLTNALTSIIQQLILNKKLDMPKKAVAVFARPS